MLWKSDLAPTKAALSALFGDQQDHLGRKKWRQKGSPRKAYIGWWLGKRPQILIPFQSYRASCPSWQNFHLILSLVNHAFFVDYTWHVWYVYIHINSNKLSWIPILNSTITALNPPLKHALKVTWLLFFFGESIIALGIYPLVNIQKTMENHFFNG